MLTGPSQLAATALVSLVLAVLTAINCQEAVLSVLRELDSLTPHVPIAQLVITPSVTPLIAFLALAAQLVKLRQVSVLVVNPDSN